MMPFCESSVMPIAVVPQANPDRLLLGDVSGQAQEDVIERRPTEADVIDDDARLIEFADDRGEPFRPAVRRRGDPTCVLIQRRRTDADLTEDPPRVVDAGPIVDDHLDPLAADLRLELVGRARSDDAAVVDDRDGIGELVGFLEILRRQQQRRPFTDQ